MNTTEFAELSAKRKSLKLAIIGIGRQLDVAAHQTAAAEKAIQLWNNEQMSQIATATQPDSDKKLYSNDIARQAELLIRQTNSSDFLNLEEAVEAVKKTQAQLIFTRQETEAELQECSALLEYELTHAADEINDAIVGITNGINAYVRQAVHTGIKELMCNLASGYYNNPTLPEEKTGIEVVDGGQAETSTTE